MVAVAFLTSLERNVLEYIHICLKKNAANLVNIAPYFRKFLKFYTQKMTAYCLSIGHTKILQFHNQDMAP
jgi:hypothetical protein